MEWRIYPPPSAPCYENGDEVFIRPKSNSELGKRGIVVVVTDNRDDTTDSIRVVDNNTGSKDKSNDDNSGRITVKVLPQPLLSSSTLTMAQTVTSSASFRRNRLIKRYRSIKTKNDNSSQASKNNINKKANKTTQIIITKSTNDYRKLASSQINYNDFVMEIGCSNGECSLLLCHYCEKFIGLDISLQMIQEAKEKFNIKNNDHNNDYNDNYQSSTHNRHTTIGAKEIEFHHIDPFQDPKKVASIIQKQSHRPNVIFIDIGGNRDLDSVLKMIQWTRDYIINVGHTGNNSPADEPQQQQQHFIDLMVVKSEAIMECILPMTNTKSNQKKISNKKKKKKKQKVDIHTNEKHDDDYEHTNTTKKMKNNHHSLVYTGQVDDSTGIIHHGEEWFKTTLQELIISSHHQNHYNHGDINHKGDKLQVVGPPKYSHPLKAPLSLSPIDNTTPICRYNNYHKNGCKKDNCQFDHVHCHWCLEKGHIASQCTKKC